MVVCDNETCIYNDGEICDREMISLTDGTCDCYESEIKVDLYK